MKVEENTDLESSHLGEINLIKVHKHHSTHSNIPLHIRTLCRPGADQSYDQDTLMKLQEVKSHDQ